MPAIKHLYTHPGPDVDGNDRIQPSDWNDEHSVQMAGPALVGRSASGTGAATDLAPKDAAALVGCWRVLRHTAVKADRTAATTEGVLATVSIPGGTIGPNGMLRVSTWWSYTSSANAKTLRVRLGGIGGTIFQELAPTTTTTMTTQTVVSNRNSQTSQLGAVQGSGSVHGGATAGFVTATIDTGAAQDLVITAQLANSGETISLERVLVEVWYGG